MSENRRYQVLFPSNEALEESKALTAEHFYVPVENSRRSSRAITLLREHRGISDHEDHLDAHLQFLQNQFGAEVHIDYQFDMDADRFPDVYQLKEGQQGQPNQSLKQVLDMIKAPDVWPISKGEGVVIAVVDTGIDGRRAEFPPCKRLGSWQPEGFSPWSDHEGHGSMCACIASGTRSQCGVFDGVAPGALLISCETFGFDSELTEIYEFLIDLKQANPDLRLITCNSFGHWSGEAPDSNVPCTFPKTLEKAVGQGIAAFFSAGNNHLLAGGKETDCGPNTIWEYKSSANVMVVGDCKLDGSMWPHSSRGPGQYYDPKTMNRKPDVIAPTPEDAEIVWSWDVDRIPAWGTSGACAQVAGLAALLLAKDPNLTPAQLYTYIREGARSLDHSEFCEGDGMIDCAATMALLPP